MYYIYSDGRRVHGVGAFIGFVIFDQNKQLQHLEQQRFEQRGDADIFELGGVLAASKWVTQNLTATNAITFYCDNANCVAMLRKRTRHMPDGPRLQLVNQVLETIAGFKSEILWIPRRANVVANFAAKHGQTGWARTPEAQRQKLINATLNETELGRDAADRHFEDHNVSLKFRKGL